MPTLRRARFEKRAMHSALLLTDDGRPPCGLRSDTLRSLDMERITCAGCQRVLALGFAAGTVKGKPPAMWLRRWALELRGAD